MNVWLRPISFLYAQVVEAKNAFYNRGYIAAHKVSCPVVSIGNLTVGGTGKTPITDYCLKALVANGKKVAVISRSYRAQAVNPTKVDIKHPKAALAYGDEPVLLAQNNPDVDVFVGSTKWKTAQFADAHNKYDLMIVDDGFQHRKLTRDLNIVIVDATEKLANYAVFPEGRARESVDSLSRADLIVISKCNLASESELKSLEGILPSGHEVLYFGYDIKNIKNPATNAVVPAAELKQSKLFLVSAIARPDVFENMMSSLGEVARKNLHYRDHHQYTAQDAKNIKEQFHSSQADYLVTTEKDAVKLRTILVDTPLWVAPLELAELGRKGRLVEKITALLN
jgi:tetraacyldisaccharide 4''-kinase